MTGKDAPRRIGHVRQLIQVLVHPIRSMGGRWECLLLRRIPSRGGFWQGVTGGVEAGEDFETAARRELLEETGFVPVVLESIGHSYSFAIERGESHPHSGASEFEEHVFVARVLGGKEPLIDTDEHNGYRWCIFDEANELLKWPENKDALTRVEEHLRRHRARHER